jgi:hypothetical protein
MFNEKKSSPSRAFPAILLTTQISLEEPQQLASAEMNKNCAVGQAQIPKSRPQNEQPA